MRRFFAAALAAGFLVAPQVYAEPNQAELVRQAHEAEERYNSIAGRMDDLLNANSALQKRVNDLSSQVGSLRSAIEDDRKQFAAALTKSVSREELKAVVEKLQEIDRKREDDKKLITGEMKKISEELAKPAPAPIVRAPAPAPVKAPEKSEDPVQEYYTHKIEKGESLSTILSAYNSALKEQGKPAVKMDAVLKANPKLNPNNLRVGKDLLIPVPQAKKSQ